MKRGLAGVRLCDVSGCYKRWSCPRHGTLTVTAPSVLGRTPREHELVPGEHFWRCKVCKYYACSCKPAPEPALFEGVDGVSGPAPRERLPRFKVGDRVRCVNAPGSGGPTLTNGAIYTVEAVLPGSYGADGERLQVAGYCWSSSRFERVQPEKPKSEKPKREWRRTGHGRFVLVGSGDDGLSDATANTVYLASDSAKGWFVDGKLEPDIIFYPTAEAAMARAEQLLDEREARA